ncbi:hypothetical protein B0H13DRAFT_2245482 [Mycena leptocephala]|nr:hypothetical protein B0H13DRAFT_2245482 [Mycena leptocephala]
MESIYVTWDPEQGLIQLQVFPSYSGTSICRERRRGGGKSGSSKGHSSGKGGSGGLSRKVGSVGAGRNSRSISNYSSGGGKVTTIPAGSPFAGHQEGSWPVISPWSSIFSVRKYGSGYISECRSGANVSGRGFPYYFWPVGWEDDSEYGPLDSSSRPGDRMTTATFRSNASEGTVFRIVFNNETVTALVTDIQANCSSHLALDSISINNFTSDGPPGPAQVIQYYRVSSAALTIDGYNNTAALDNRTADLLDCLNQTPGAAISLLDCRGARSRGLSWGLFSAPYCSCWYFTRQ